jgi:homoserine O-acetyltransferase/O-succinyltransferase
MNKHQYCLGRSFPLECGEVLPELNIAYHTSGTLNPAKDNVLWVCHALTANSDVEDWWDVLVGEGKYYDTSRYFVVCANMIGSCYGTTGPLSTNPETGKPYFRSFPQITVRDLANAHELLRKHLGIDRIHTIIGGSIGAFQALEWAIINSDVCEHLIIVASNARVTPWATALNESQRMAIRADKTFFEDRPDGGLDGLKAARTVALVSYRSYEGYNKTQLEEDGDSLENTRAASYQQYQGQKLASRFDAYSYYTLTRIIDSHNVGRNRGGVAAALSKIKAKTLLVGIDTDFLFPIEEQRALKALITNAQFAPITSSFGHDGFLLEWRQLSRVIEDFYASDCGEEELECCCHQYDTW